MDYSIRFPHLGLVFSHVPRSFTVFGYEIALYGVVIALAMLAGIALASCVAGRTGQDPDDYVSLALWGIVAALIGARAYYVAFSWDYYSQHPAQILNLRGGGLAIYGGVIAGVITCVIFARRRGRSVVTMLDTGCLGLLIGQVIGRFGNFFNREAFGGYTDSLLAMQLPVSAVRASEITPEMQEHLVTLDGTTFIQVHPTFLYESLWNTAVLLILLHRTLRKGKAFEGEIFLLYVFFYGLGRMWIEGLRTDQLRLPGTDIAVSQVLAAVSAAAALGLLLWRRSRRAKTSE